MDVLNALIRDFMMPSRVIDKLCETAPSRYKVYKIPKKTSGKFRTIAQPSPEIKALQRWVDKNIISLLPVHSSAAAYRKGRGIRSNAELHSSGSYLLKMDFKEFFNSLKPHDFLMLLEKNFPGRFSGEDCARISNILFWKPKDSDLCMSIGAPSSPSVSNAIMYEFDSTISEYCKILNVVYSRYADDLSFSAIEKGVLYSVQERVKLIVNSLSSPSLKINEEKTIHASRARLRQVTGVILTPEGRLSIGRERKRLIRSMLDYYSKGRLGREEIRKLRGLLSFSLDVEPQYIISIREKYGDKVDIIMKSPLDRGKVYRRSSSISISSVVSVLDVLK
jgi:retron-type reverse transcriptase